MNFGPLSSGTKTVGIPPPTNFCYCNVHGHALSALLVHKCEREDRSADLSHDLRVVSSTPAIVAEWGLRVGDDFSRVVEPHDLAC